VLFGRMPVRVVGDLYADRLRTWQEWEALALQANGH
jgi:hypothetical protein